MALILDPMSMTSAEMAQYGRFGKKHWWSILTSRPGFDTLMGRPRGSEQLSHLLTDAKASAGPGHKMLPPSKRIYEPVVHTDAGSPTRSIQGLDEWTYERGHHTGTAEWRWKYYATPIVMSEQDMIENSGAGNDVVITNLREWAMKVAMEKHLDKINTDLWTADGTGNGNREMQGVAAHIPSNPTTGLIGGFNLATKTDMRNQYNAILPGTPSAGSRGDFFANWGDDFRRMYLRTRRGLYTGEGYQFGVMGESLFENYESVLTPRDYTQYPISKGGDKPKGRTGYYCLGFKDVEFVPEWSLAAGTMYWITVPAFCFVTMQGHWLQTRGWQEHMFQWGRVTVVISGCNTIVPQLRAQGVIDGYTFTS